MERFKINKKTNLRIENALIFLKYTYKELNKETFSDIDISTFDTLTEVYLRCLLKCVNILTKRGLYKEYIKRENKELKSPKGIINISESLSKQTRLRGSLICSYEELSDNVLHNQIIKSVLKDLQYNEDIKKEQIIQIKKQLISFKDIDEIDLRGINFNKIKYNNNNIRYKTIMDICRDLYFKININKYISSNNNYKDKRSKFTFEDNLFISFRKHLYNFYKQNYKDSYRIDIIEVPINENTCDKFDLIYSKSKKLITLKSDKTIIIIDCYKDYQFTDIEKKDKQEDELRRIIYNYSKDTRLDVFGAIIYVNCSEGYCLKNSELSNRDNITIMTTTIDMNIKYNYIDNKLRKIVDTLLD